MTFVYNEVINKIKAMFENAKCLNELSPEKHNAYASDNIFYDLFSNVRYHNIDTYVNSHLRTVRAYILLDALLLGRERYDYLLNKIEQIDSSDYIECCLEKNKFPDIESFKLVVEFKNIDMFIELVSEFID